MIFAIILWARHMDRSAYLLYVGERDEIQEEYCDRCHIAE